MDELRVIEQIENGIKVTDGRDNYSVGMRNGMKWALSLIDGNEPIFDGCRHSPKPEALTLEEMSHMHGEPVFIVEFGTFSGKEWNILDNDVPVDFDLQDVNFKNGDCYASYNYGKTWLAYAQKIESGDSEDGNQEL